ncbi:MAG: polyprenol monophosphomannose synthase [Chloroflexi bacterium]|nr:polyprenol monophosphomannose synthase [Chloroflexota bacterium]
MSAAVVIPTYNESQNIAPLVEGILEASAQARVIIVDDNSPDGTGQIADEMAAKHPEVEVIHRQGKGGRGSACIAGFRRALARPEHDYFLEMDADFSHDPRDIPRLLEAAQAADVVIGSRYIRGAKIVNWGIQRHIFSHIANGFARLLLGIPIHDYTNGYRCYNRRALESVDFDRIEAHGYIVLSEMACQLHQRRMRFVEIPIVFVNRRRGKSNTTLREISEAFTSVLQLRRKYGKS